MKWLVRFALLLIVLAALFIWWFDANRLKAPIEQRIRLATGQEFKIEDDIKLSWYPWLGIQMGRARLGSTQQPLVRWRSLKASVRLWPLLRGEQQLSRMYVDQLKLYFKKSPDGSSNWDFLTADASKSGASPMNVTDWQGLELRDATVDYLDEAADQHLRLLNWQLTVSAWQPNELIAIQSRFSVARPKTATQRIPVSINFPGITWQLEPLQFRIPKFALTIANAQFDGGAHLASLAPLRAKGAINFKTDSLRKWLTALNIGGPRPKDSGVLQRMQAGFQWSITERLLKIDPLQIKLDQLDLQGFVQQKDVAEKATWQFDLRGNHLPMERYLVFEDQDTPPFKLPTAALQALPATGKIIFETARFGNSTLRDVELRFEDRSQQPHQ
jgi:hypothetical protein